MQAVAIPPVYDMFISFLGAFLGILWVSGCASALNDRLNEHLLVASLGATAVLIYGVPESPLAQPRCVIGTAASNLSIICFCYLVCHGITLTPYITGSMYTVILVTSDNSWCVVLQKKSISLCMHCLGVCSHRCWKRFAGGHVVSAAVGAAFRLALQDLLWVAAPLGMALALVAMQLTRTVHPPGGLQPLTHHPLGHVSASPSDNMLRSTECQNIPGCVPLKTHDDAAIIL